MEWKEVGDWLKGNAGGVAGLVGSLMTGNIPGIITFGAGLVKQATGTDDPATALAQLQQNPEAMVKLREIAAANEASVRDHLFRMEQLVFNDLADARKRDTAFVSTGRWNWRADILAVLAVGGLVTCVWFIARDSDMEERAVNAIMFVAGVLAAAVRDVYSFEFGSSRGSKEKDEVFLASLRNK
jgi:hypothetical protein